MGNATEILLSNTKKKMKRKILSHWKKIICGSQIFIIWYKQVGDYQTDCGHNASLRPSSWPSLIFPSRRWVGGRYQMTDMPFQQNVRTSVAFYIKPDCILFYITWEHTFRMCSGCMLEHSCRTAGTFKQDCWSIQAGVLEHTCRTAGACMQDCWGTHAQLLGHTHRDKKCKKHDSDPLQ